MAMAKNPRPRLEGDGLVSHSLHVCMFAWVVWLLCYYVYLLMRKVILLDSIVGQVVAHMYTILASVIAIAWIVFSYATWIIVTVLRIAGPAVLRTQEGVAFVIVVVAAAVNAFRGRA